MEKQSQSKSLWRLSAMGFTFASMIIAGGLLGWVLVWVLGKYDATWLERKNAFIVGGVVFGIVIGMVDFIRTAQRAMRDMDR
jgi:F0F1-type ATP synthase assembly protein I